jgi:hypothetical protein
MTNLKSSPQQNCAFAAMPFVLFLVLTSSIAYSQETRIKGFNDVQFGRMKTDTAKYPGRNRGFVVGQYDLFITSQINDRVTFLGETVFEWDNESKAWSLDLERAIIKYSIKDYFNISAGKFHTAFGYWNNAFHHGSVIQPTITRPVIVRFEDNGGYLPIHQVGVQFTGAAITSKNFGYNIFVSNGQSQGNSGGAQTYNTQALSGNVSVEPVENLQFIASFFTQRVPAGSRTYQDVVLTEDSKYTLLNGAVAYFNPSSPVEFTAEYYNISNTMTSVYNANAFFVYVGLPINKKLVPYVVYNKASFQTGNTFFIKNDINETTFGLRYIFSPQVVWKLEYSTSNSELYHNSSLLQTQFAIGF